MDDDKARAAAAAARAALPDALPVARESKPLPPKLPWLWRETGDGSDMAPDEALAPLTPLVAERHALPPDTEDWRDVRWRGGLAGDWDQATGDGLPGVPRGSPRDGAADPGVPSLMAAAARRCVKLSTLAAGLVPGAASHTSPQPSALGAGDAAAGVARGATGAGASTGVS